MTITTGHIYALFAGRITLIGLSLLEFSVDDVFGDLPHMIPLTPTIVKTICGAPGSYLILSVSTISFALKATAT